MARCLFVVPALRHVRRPGQRVVDDGAVADDRADGAKAPGPEHVEQLIEAGAVDHDGVADPHGSRLGNPSGRG